MLTIKVELRIDFSVDTENKNKIAIETAKMGAKHWLSTMMLIMDKRKPLVAVEAGDMFTPSEEISLVDPLDIDCQDTLDKATAAAGVDDGNA